MFFKQTEGNIIAISQIVDDLTDEEHFDNDTNAIDEVKYIAGTAVGGEEVKFPA